MVRHVLVGCQITIGSILPKIREIRAIRLSAIQTMPPNWSGHNRLAQITPKLAGSDCIGYQIRNYICLNKTVLLWKK